MRHWDHREDDDHYAQPGALYRLMSDAERDRLAANTARSMGDAPLHIRQHHVQNCSRADADYGARVAAALGLG